MLILTLVATMLIGATPAQASNLTEHNVVTGPEWYRHAHWIQDSNAYYQLDFRDRIWRHSRDWLYFYRMRVYGGPDRVIRGTPRWQEHYTVDSVRGFSIRSDRIYDSFISDWNWREQTIESYIASNCPSYCVYTEQWSRSGGIWTRYVAYNYYHNY